MSLLSAVNAAPRDPILGLTEAFVADQRPGKVNLGVGVYTDEHGRVPLLGCVQAVQTELAAAGKPFGYLPIDGLASYDSAVVRLVLGDQLERDRVAVMQTLGGTGALRLAADFLDELLGAEQPPVVLLSDPSWENHAAIFGRAGFDVQRYPYYDPQTRGVDVPAMLARLEQADPGTVVVLHACCHNPTGNDLTEGEWAQVLAVVARRGLVPLLDLAYQGFAESLEADGAAVRMFARSGVLTLITSSFSKTFSLYGERVGALSVVCGDTDEARRVLSRLKVLARTSYSNPPTHGASIVARVLDDDQLRAQWVDELGAMRTRIKQMRAGLRAGLEADGVPGDLSHITSQNGMFSYSGLSAAQMQALRTEHAVYGLDSGRICVAALNQANLPRVVEAIAAVS